MSKNEKDCCHLNCIHREVCYFIKKSRIAMTISHCYIKQGGFRSISEEVAKQCIHYIREATP